MVVAGFKSIDRLVIQIDAKTKGAEAALKRIDKSVQQIDKNVEKQTKAAFVGFKALQGQLLGFGLSFLFTGMAIQRFFQGMLLSMAQTFLQAEGSTSVLGDKLDFLKSKLAFVAFDFFEAFTQDDTIDKLLKKIDGILDKLIDLDDTTKSNIVQFILLAAAVGIALLVFGQLTLGLLGVIAFISFLASNPIVLLIAGFFLVILAIGFLMRKLGGLKNFFKSVMRGIINLTALAAQIMVEKFLDGINFIIRIIQQLLSKSLRAPDIVGAATRFNERFLALPTDQPQQAQNVVNVNVEGSVITEQELTDKILSNFELNKLFNQGSPQSG
jgi:hypothetical protein